MVYMCLFWLPMDCLFWPTTAVCTAVAANEQYRSGTDVPAVVHVPHDIITSAHLRGSPRVALHSDSHASDSSSSSNERMISEYITIQHNKRGEWRHSPARLVRAFGTKATTL